MATKLKSRFDYDFADTKGGRSQPLSATLKVKPIERNPLPGDYKPLFRDAVESVKVWR